MTTGKIEKKFKEWVLTLRTIYPRTDTICMAPKIISA